MSLFSYRFLLPMEVLRTSVVRMLFYTCLLCIFQSSSAQVLPKFWQTPVNYSAANSTADEYAPFYNMATKSLYFTSERSGKARIYQFMFDSISALKSVSSAPQNIISPPDLADKQVSYLRFHPNDGSALLTQYRATRAGAKLNTFSTSLQNTTLAKTIPISWLNTDAFVGHATFSPSGQCIVFSSDRTDYGSSGKCDLFLAELVNGTWTIRNMNYRASNGSESGPNGSNDEITPFFASDSVLYFASNSHAEPRTDFNIYYVVREDNGHWSTPTLVESLSGPADDTDPCLLNDGTILFASNRMGGLGGFDLYYARPADNQPTTLTRTPTSRPEILIITQPDRIRWKNSTLLETFPLLPFIFFGENSTQLPPEIKTLSSADAALYDPDRIRATSLTAYFEILNILGKRMQFYSNTTIELIGTALTRETTSTRSAKDIARTRAETVRSYLHQVWGIADDRMTIRSTVLESSPTLPTSRIDELRTVEIRTQSAILLAPIRMGMEQVFPMTDTLLIRLEKRNTIPHTQWTLSARLQGMPLTTNSGHQLPAVEIVPLHQKNILLQQGASSISIEATIARNGQNESPTSTTIDVPIERIDERKDSILRFTLLTNVIDNKSVLTQEVRQQIALIAKRIGKNMRVLIRSAYDGSLPPDEAQSVTHQQAQLIQSALQQLLAPSIALTVSFDTRGLGNAPQYDNNQSYGRLYSRSVIIQIDRP